MKKGDANFDIGMGAYDGAESCDLIGLYLLHLLTNQIPGLEVGLYRDDGLCVSGATKRVNEKLRQKIVKVFQENGLSITSIANCKSVEFLDTTLDLKSGTFKPYIKPGDKPTYVHSGSNHPPAIIKNIPISVNKRLSKLSANEEIFKNAIPIFQAELDRNGYKHKLKFDQFANNKKGKKRTKNKIYFNPPYSMNVKTNIGAKFLRLLDTHFPPGSHLPLASTA